MFSNLTFNEMVKYEPGTIFRLLSECHSEILEQQLQDRLRKFDCEVFENLETVGKCTFVTTLGTDIVGMASYDPRQAPKLGKIGYNCILPGHQKKGYGKRQILEILRRLKEFGVVRITVSTSEHPFFEPARKMYLSCGFSELDRQQKEPQDIYKIIQYEMKL